MLDRPQKPEFDHPSSVLYFAVPDIQCGLRKIERRRSALRGRAAPDRENAGARLVDEVFRDTEGNLLALMSEVAR
jgi:methylmalonyl-CoA/ethylmalonyl-CoA epimerase